MFHIKPFWQDKTRFCTVYAVCHALMIEYSTLAGKEVKINPFRVILDVFRYKGWLYSWNSSFNPYEVISALKKYGISVDGVKKYPQGLDYVSPEDVEKLCRSGKPILATINQSHEIVIINKLDNHETYEIIDSSSRKNPYRFIKDPTLTTLLKIRL